MSKVAHLEALSHKSHTGATFTSDSVESRHTSMCKKSHYVHPTQHEAPPPSRSSPFLALLSLTYEMDDLTETDEPAAKPMTPVASMVSLLNASDSAVNTSLTWLDSNLQEYIKK